MHNQYFMPEKVFCFAGGIPNNCRCRQVGQVCLSERAVDFQGRCGYKTKSRKIMERSVNRVELKGRVGQDAKILKVENGGTAARFTLATNEIIKGRNDTLREETTWHNIVAWSRKGMPDFDKIRKGTFVAIEGKIRYVKYTAATGEEKSMTEILAQKIIIPLVE